MLSDTNQDGFTGLNMNGQQDIEAADATGIDDDRLRKVDGDIGQRLDRHLQIVVPTSPSVGRRRDAVATQDVADSPSVEIVAQRQERPGDPPPTPTVVAVGVLDRQLHDQRLDHRRGLWFATGFCSCDADQFAMPAADSLCGGDMGDLRESLPANGFALYRKQTSIIVCKIPSSGRAPALKEAPFSIQVISAGLLAEIAGIGNDVQDHGCVQSRGRGRLPSRHFPQAEWVSGLLRWKRARGP